MNAKLESIAVKAADDLTWEKAMTTPKAIDPERGEWTSASSAEADELCHARHKRCLGLPDTSGPDAERGTRIHAVMAGETVDLAPDEAECVERLREMEKKPSGYGRMAPTLPAMTCAESKGYGLTATR